MRQEKSAPHFDKVSGNIHSVCYPSFSGANFTTVCGRWMQQTVQ
jgi:hypothetical protein